MSEATANLGTRTATGAAWMASQTAVTRVLGLFSQLVLTWLLVPEDFGRLGLVWTITAFATQLIDPGIDDVLLQRRAQFNRWATPAFWMSLTFSVGGALVMVAVAYLIVVIARSQGNLAYGDPTLVKMIGIMALAGPLTALGLVPLVKLRADMRFARLSGLLLIEFVALQVLTIGFAAFKFGSYSLVLPLPIVAAGRSLVFWWTARPRVRPRLQLHRWQSLIGSTGWVFGERLLQAFVNQGDYMFLGAFLADKTIVGQYFFAYMLSVQVIRVVGANLVTALTPALNALHEDVPRMQAAAIRASRAVTAIIVPLVVLQILLAGPIVRLLFASKWEPAIPLLRYLSFGMLLIGAAWPMQSIIPASGRFCAGFFMRLMSVICFALIVAPMTYVWHEKGTAIGVSIWSWMTAGIIVVVTLQSLRGITTLFSIVAHPLLASVPGTLVATLLIRWTEGTTVASDITAVLLTSVIVGGSYLLLLRLVDRRTVDTLNTHFRTVLAAWQAAFPRLVRKS